jgi:hypothetical protein
VGRPPRSRDLVRCQAATRAGEEKRYPGPQESVSGRQIRWASLGRALAIGAIVLLGVISLPSLLGGGSPPPLPKDVGLAQAPPPAPPVPASVVAPTTPVAQSPEKRSAKASKSRRSRERAGGHRPGEGHKNKSEGERGSQTGSAVGTSAPSIAVAPAPGYAPAVRRGEFRFER